MRSLVIFSILLLRCFLALFRDRQEQAIVELALRQQLVVYADDRSRPRLGPPDRTLWVVLSRLWPRWKEHLVVVRPETVVRWHREGEMLVISSADGADEYLEQTGLPVHLAKAPRSLL